MNKEKIIVSVVVPVFNEAPVIAETYRRLKTVLDATNEPYEIIFVNDGSRDQTLTKAKQLWENDPRLKLLSFSRNFGHQAAITAGMDYAVGAAVVVIDADLQDPPEVIPQMIAKWKEGYQVVYGKRLERKGESCFKRITAKLFYRLLRSLTNIEIPVDTGDFRLIDRQVCDALKTLPEQNRYVRGLVSWVGFRQTGVEFIREERFAGGTKYPLKKMLKFAADAITAFSDKPLKLATYGGIALTLAGLAELFYTAWAGLNGWDTGGAGLFALNFLVNGFVLIMLGIVGEYIGRIYDEAKERPLYLISEKLGFDEPQ